MRIRIVSPGDGFVWYSQYVGEVFDVIRKDESEPEYFWTREPEGFLNIVYRHDCEIIGEQ